MGCADLKMNASETVITRYAIDYYNKVSEKPLADPPQPRSFRLH